MVIMPLAVSTSAVNTFTHVPVQIGLILNVCNGLTTSDSGTNIPSGYFTVCNLVTDAPLGYVVISVMVMLDEHSSDVQLIHTSGDW